MKPPFYLWYPLYPKPPNYTYHPVYWVVFDNPSNAFKSTNSVFKDMFTIDGSKGEGGGQIIRTSIALSAVTGRPVKIINIRANRPKPGLAAQHLTGILAAKELCRAEVEGAEIGSTRIQFTPGKITGGSYKINIGTAGAITLVLQTLIPISINAETPTKLEITGGTDVSWSPSADYLTGILFYFLNKIGIEIEAKTMRRGFYPKGGGNMTVKISPSVPKTLILTERGALEKCEAYSLVSIDLRKSYVAERQLTGFKAEFKKPAESFIEYSESDSSGTSIFARAMFENTILGASAMGKPGKPAEHVGKECANLLKAQIDSSACLDEWMADQILPYLALVGGKISAAKITSHTKTNMEIIEKFLPVKFKITESIPCIIETLKI